MSGGEFTVAKWGYPALLADGTCHCSRPLKFNLRERIVGHAEGPVEECPEPWPDRPAPEEYELSRRMQSLLAEGSAKLDQAFGLARCPSRIAHESGVVLRCQREPHGRGQHRTLTALWVDGDDREIEPGASFEPPEQRAARLPTEAEQQVLDHLKRQHRDRVAKARGGQFELPVDGSAGHGR